jgi:hypothetical protein
LGITRFFPSHRLAYVLKAPGKEKDVLSTSSSYLAPPCPLLYFPSLTFNKLKDTHMSCHGFFLMGHKEFGNLLITDSTIAINKLTQK